MRVAGIDELQPGIETFSDNILSLMRKGVKAIQQVEFIKWGTEANIGMIYGVIYGTPGETADDYRKMATMINKIRHLTPPLYVTPLMLDRFSPYYENPAAYGITGIKPREQDVMAYSEARTDLKRLMYHFSYENPGGADSDLQDNIQYFLDLVRQWREEFRPNTLIFVHEPDGVRIRDTRGKPKSALLRGLQADIFLLCDSHRSFDEICRHWPGFDQLRLRRFLGQMVSHGFMYCDHNKYLSLPIERVLETVNGRSMIRPPATTAEHRTSVGKPLLRGSNSESWQDVGRVSTV